MENLKDSQLRCSGMFWRGTSAKSRGRNKWCVQETERCSVWHGWVRVEVGGRQEVRKGHGRELGFYSMDSEKPSKRDGVTWGRGVTDSSNRSRSRSTFLMFSPHWLLTLSPSSCVNLTFFQPDPFVLVQSTIETENNWLYHLSPSVNFLIFSKGMHSLPFTQWDLFLSFTVLKPPEGVDEMVL